MLNKPHENRFYEPVKKVVEDTFKSQGYSFEFEITASLKGKIPKKFIKDKALQKFQGKLPTPDIMGWVWRDSKFKKLVIVEFKREPKFWDIAQVKGYGELYGSDFTLLLSQKPLHDTSKPVLDYVEQHPDLAKVYINGKATDIFIMFLDKQDDGSVSLVQLSSDLNKIPLFHF